MQALDVVGSKRSVDGRHRAEEGQPMPVMIPKCLQEPLQGSGLLTLISRSSPHPQGAGG